MRPRSSRVKSAAAGLPVLKPADLRRLEHNAHKACALQPLIGLSQSALSQHLGVLRRKHLVRARRAGQSVYYSLSSGDAAAVMTTLHTQFCRR
jgi:DNA-binding transcriptional ArsR family regulator